MDCMTISTFRSLEQQAIRQYRETKKIESTQKYESFGHEKYQTTKTTENKNISKQKITTDKGKINYYA